METRIGFTAGAFDLFHYGHLLRLQRASEACDRLIVAVSTDECVFSYKRRRPIIPFEERLSIVAALRFVDVAVPQNDLDKYAAWQLYRFDVFVLGDEDSQLTNAKPYLPLLTSAGVDIVISPTTKGISTSILIDRIRSVPR